MTTQLDFKPKYDKIIEALLYFAHRKPGMDHYHACKLIYLADREHLNKYGRPVVFDRHLALPWGAAASKTYELLKGEHHALAAAGVDDLPFATEKLDKLILIKEPKRAVKYEVFSKSDLKILDHVIDTYAHLSFDELHNITIRHFAYQKAWNDKRENAKQADMSYDDILEESAGKSEYLSDIGPVAKFMR